MSMLKTTPSLRVLIPALVLAMAACGDVPSAPKAASAAKSAPAAAGEGVAAATAQTIVRTLEKIMPNKA